MYDFDLAWAVEGIAPLPPAITLAIRSGAIDDLRPGGLLDRIWARSILARGAWRALAQQAALDADDYRDGTAMYGNHAIV